MVKNAFDPRTKSPNPAPTARHATQTGLCRASPRRKMAQMALPWHCKLLMVHSKVSRYRVCSACQVNLMASRLIGTLFLCGSSVPWIELIPALRQAWKWKAHTICEKHTIIEAMAFTLQSWQGKWCMFWTQGSGSRCLTASLN